MSSEYEVATTTEERNWGMAAHLGAPVTAWFALGIIAPLAVLLLKGSSSPYVRRHAVESLNFQINALILGLLGGLLLVLLIGWLLLPLYIAYGIFYVVCVVIASMRASAGEPYRYPLTVRFVS